MWEAAGNTVGISEAAVKAFFFFFTVPKRRSPDSRNLYTTSLGESNSYPSVESCTPRVSLKRVIPSAYRLCRGARVDENSVDARFQIN